MYPEKEKGGSLYLKLTPNPGVARLSPKGVLKKANRAEKKSQYVSSTDLKKFKGYVFDSLQNGHSCNCTVFFQFLREMELADKIEGKGAAEDPPLFLLFSA